jgi:hypothetical protein
MIRRRIPDLASQITGELVDVEDVVQVEADAVLRLVRNPDGYASETDGTYSYQFSRAMATGQLEILPGEWAMLGVRASGMFQIVPNVARPTPVPFGSGG